MPELSEYRAMWLMCMFDLPTTAKVDRRRYAEFRKTLLESGFLMMQYSVYFKFCSTRDIALRYQTKVERHLPVRGKVRVITFTDAQFARMHSYTNLVAQPVEAPPEQMKFF